MNATKYGRGFLTIYDNLPPYPNDWKILSGQIVVIFVSPDGATFFCELRGHKYVLCEAKIATKEDAARTDGRLNVGQFYVGEDFAEMPLTQKT